MGHRLVQASQHMDLPAVSRWCGPQVDGLDVGGLGEEELRSRLQGLFSDTKYEMTFAPCTSAAVTNISLCPPCRGIHVSMAMADRSARHSGHPPTQTFY